MSLVLTCRFDVDDHVLELGLPERAGRIGTAADVEAFRAAFESRCAVLKGQRVHLFVNLANLAVEAEQAPAFAAALRELCRAHGETTWHFGGHLAERVMIRNDSTRRGERPNLFKTREEALQAFRAQRRRSR